MNPLSDEAHQEPNEEAILATEIVLNKFTLNTANGFSAQETQKSFDIQNFENKNIVVDNFHPRVQSGRQDSNNLIFVSSSHNRISQDGLRMTGAIFSIKNSKKDEPSIESEQESFKKTSVEIDHPMTREELQAHLDAQQARMEAMLARQSADTDRHLSRFEARLDQSLQQMHQDRQDQKEDSRSTRNTVIGTVGGSALAILLALFGAVYAINSMNSSIIGNVISAFESGKSSAQAEPPVRSTAPASSAPK